MADIRDVRNQRGITLPEVLMAATVALMICLAVLQVLVPAQDLDLRSEQRSRGLEVAEGALEDAHRQAALPAGFRALTSAPYTYSDTAHFYVARRTVVDVSASVKKVTVLVYRADPDTDQPLPDANSPRGGFLLQLSLLVVAP